MRLRELRASHKNKQYKIYAYRVEISWEITVNTNRATLKDAYIEDFIPSDQRLIPDSIQLNEAAYNAEATSESESFVVNLPDGPKQHTITFRTSIYSYPSNDRQVKDKYNNTGNLVNYSKDETLEEEYKVTLPFSASANYFKENENNNPGKTGTFDYDTDLMTWEVTINPNKLPIQNAYVIDTISLDAELLSNPAIKVYLGGEADDEKLLTKDEDYKYEFSVDEDNQSFFKLSFLENKPNGEIENGIHNTYHLVYAAQLKTDFTGITNVTNTVKVEGETLDTSIDENNSSVEAEKWFVGASGSATDVNLNVVKRDLDTGERLGGVKFQVIRVTGSGSSRREQVIGGEDAVHETIEDAYTVFNAVRAGRYILREVEPLAAYQAINDVYLILSYNADGEASLKITDDNWENGSEDSDLLEVNHVNGENVLTFYNEKQKKNVTANKIWVGNNPQTDIWFELYRTTNLEEGYEKVPGASRIKLPVGTKDVTWSDIVKLDPTGKEYTFAVKEVDEYGLDFTPDGFTKIENGTTVTNKSELIEITVVKEWSDGENQDDIRPESVDVELTANGKGTEKKISLSETNNWTHTFEELDEYDVKGKKSLTL